MAALQNWKKTNHSSLFERIQQDSSTNHSENDPLSSVKRNLKQVLNVRPNSCQSAKELGVIDLNDATMSTSELNSLICESIKNCIEQYEPRVSITQVQARPDNEDPLTLSFSVIAYVNKEKIEFDIKLDREQQYQL